MNNKSLLWVILAIVIVGGGILFFSSRRASEPVPGKMDGGSMEAKNLEGEIVLGAVMPLTGDGAAYGLPIQRATELAVEELNSAGGIDGKKVVIRYEDGKCDGKEALTAAQKLQTVDGVQAIIGGVCSGEVLGMASALNENGTVLLSPSATSPDITEQGGDFVFRLVPSDAFAANVAASFAYDDLGDRRFAVFAEQTDYAQGLRSGFTNAIREKGGEIVLDESWNVGTTDFRTQALKIKNAGVDAVYLVPQTPAPGIAFLEALRDQQVSAVILTAEVMTGRDVAAENAELMEGVYGFEARYSEDDAGASRFLSAYEARYEEKAAFPFFMANAYSSVYLLKELIEAGGNDGAALQQALSELDGWKGGALDSVTFDENGDILWNTYQVKRIRGGEVTDDKVFTF